MPFCRADNGSSAPTVCRFGPPIAAATLAVVVVSLGVGQQTLGTQQSREKLIQEAYAKHDVKIRQMLPPYSGSPLLLDLYQRRLEDGICDPGRHLAWENHFNGIMGGHTIHSSFGDVYVKFTLEVLKEFQKGKSSLKQGSRKSGQVTAVEFGGSVRFPSGYLETFLLSQEGFVKVGEKYVLFMWKPVPSDDTLVISQAYLIRDGFVFPVDTDGDAQTVYTKMPLPEFEAKVEAAVQRNIDTDVLPNVHASPRRSK